MSQIAAVILAAGKGTRMNEGQASPIPKVMFPIGDKPMIHYSVKHVKDAGVSRVVLVVGYKSELVREYMGEEAEYVLQTEQLGTGHAVSMAKDILMGQSDAVLVCYGDMPLFKSETIRQLIAKYEEEKPTVAMLSVVFEDPEFWAFGRIIRDENGEVTKSVEQKDCTLEQLKIKESNPCFYIFNAEWLWQNIGKLSTDNAQSEYYLTDMVQLACDQGERIIAIPTYDETEALGVNNPEQLKQAEEVLNKREKEDV